jgi:predicted lipoprotein with Yx(FWY)xxD motif
MRLALVLVTVALFLGADQAPAGPAAGTIVKARASKHLKSTVLVNARGLTLYIYTPDGKGQSTCVDDPTYHCSRVWPPLRTMADPIAGAGVKQALLGTTEREGGQLQVTYAGRPLYTFAGYAGTPGDKKPGDLNGQAFIAAWYVITPAGKLVRRH